MNALADFWVRWLEPEACVRLTQALGHFLWQGCAVALLYAVVSRILARRSANARYVVGVVALVAMAACLPVTWALLPSEARSTSVAHRAPHVPNQSEDLTGPKSGSDMPRAAELTTSGPSTFGLPTTVMAERGTADPVQAIVNGSVARPLLVKASPYATFMYIAGVLVMLMRVLLGLWGGHRLRRDAIPVANAAVLDMVRAQAVRLALRVVPVVAYCSRVSVPIVIGIVRPMILLPSALVTGLTESQLEAVLLHELAHVRRYDLAVNVLQRVIEALLFFHPAMWWVSHRVHLEREDACDDLVIGAACHREQYADALVRVAELCAGARAPSHASALGATGRSASQLNHRLLRLFGADDQAGFRVSSNALLLGLLMVLVPLLMSPVVVPGQAPSKEEKKDRTASADPSTDNSKDNTPVAKEKEDAEPPDPNRPWIAVGRVMDADGRPLEGVDVKAFAGVGTLKNRGRTTSDKDGRYRLEFGPGVVFVENKNLLQAATIFASKPGYFEQNLCRQGNRRAGFARPDDGSRLWDVSPEKVFLPNKRKTIDFVMQPAAVLEGEFVESSNGWNVREQTFSIMGKDLPPSSNVLASVKTDRHGKFLVDAIPAGREWRIGMRVPNTPHDIESKPFQFDKPGIYRCKLVLANKTDGEGVQLALRIEDLERKPDQPPAAQGDTKEAGTAEPAAPKEDGVKPESGAAKPDAKPNPTEQRVVTGRVTDEQGNAIAGALVEWGHFRAAKADRQRTKTDQEGRYRMIVDKVGASYRLGVSADGHAPAWQDNVIPEKGDSSKPIDFKLAAPHAITGTVVDGNGQPVADVKVAAQTPSHGFYSSFSSPVPSSPLPGLAREVNTSADGTFELKNLPAEKVALALADSSSFAIENTYPVDKPAQIVFQNTCAKPEPGEVRLRVTDAAGDPIQDYSVALRYKPKTYQVQAADGRTLLRESIIKGRQGWIYVYAPGYIPRGIELTAAGLDEAEEQTVKLERGELVRGKLVDADTNQPLGGVSILCGDRNRSIYFEWGDINRYCDGHHGFEFVRRIVTRPDGTFEIGEQPGQTTFFIQHEGYGRAIFGPDLRGKPDAEGRVMLRLQPESTISGVFALDDEPVPGADIQLWQSAPRTIIEQRFPPVKTDAQGRFEFHNLQPGTYRLVSDHLSREVTIGRGEKQNVALGANLGPFTLRGNAGAFVRVSVSPKFDWDYSSIGAEADADGNYRISGLRSGEYQVHLFTFNEAHGNSFHASYTVEIKGNSMRDFWVFGAAKVRARRPESPKSEKPAAPMEPTRDDKVVPEAAAEPKDTKPIIDKESPKKAEPVAAALPVGEPHRVTGLVVDEAGQPVASAEVQRFDWSIHQPFRKTVARDHTTTDDNGQFRFDVGERPWSRLFDVWLVARDKRGHQGLAYCDPDKFGPGYAPCITLRPMHEVLVKVVDGQGKPIEGASVQVANISDVITILGHAAAASSGADDADLPILATKSAADGTALLRFPADATHCPVVAFKSGAGLDYFFTHDPNKGEEPRFSTGQKPKPWPRSIALHLTGARKARMIAVDEAKRPLAGVVFSVSNVMLPDRPYASQGLMRPSGINLTNCEGVRATTNAAGIAEFDWLPQDFAEHITFNLVSKDYNPWHQTAFSPRLPELERGQQELTAVLVKRTPISGHVQLPDGSPAAGIKIEAQGCARDGESGHGEAVTNDDGSYLMFAESDRAYIVSVVDERWAALTHDRVIAKGQPIEKIDFQLAPGTIVHGTAMGADRRPLAFTEILLTKEIKRPPGDENKIDGSDGYRFPSFYRRVKADATGRYKLCVGPGQFEIGLIGLQRRDFEVDHEAELSQDLWLPSPKALKAHGIVIDADGKPAPGAKINGYYERFDYPLSNDITSAADGTFEIQVEPLEFYLSAITEDRRQAGIVMGGEFSKKIKIRLKPTINAYGRVVDRQGNPITKGVITYWLLKDRGAGIEAARLFETPTTPDADGRFTLTGLLYPSWNRYQVTYSANQDDSAAVPLTEVPPLTAQIEKYDLGTLPVGSANGPEAELTRAILHAGVLRRDDRGFVVEVTLGDKATDELLEKLASLPTLKTLSLSQAPGITSRGIEAVGRIASLESLTLPNMKLTNADMLSLTGLSRLHELDFDCNQLTDAGAIAIKKLQSLRSLNLSGNRLTDAGLSSVAALGDLEILSISNSSSADTAMRITNTGLQRLVPLRHLREIDLSKTDVTSEGLHYLQLLPELESVWLQGDRITDEAIDPLADCPKLKRLGLSVTRITDKGFAKLATIENLEWLDVHSDNITDTGIAHLAKLKHLKHLVLSGCPLTDKSLEAISRITTLERLQLENSMAALGQQKGMQFTAQGISRLEALNRLKILWVSFDGQDLMTGAFRKLKQLDELIFSHGPGLNNEEWLKLQRALPYTRVEASSGKGGIIGEIYQQIMNARKPRPKVAAKAPAEPAVREAEKPATGEAAPEVKTDPESPAPEVKPQTGPDANDNTSIVKPAAQLAEAQQLPEPPPGEELAKAILAAGTLEYDEQHRITGVWLSGATDDLLEQLAQVKTLKSLRVNGAKYVSPRGLAAIGRMVRLESLELIHMKLSNPDMLHLTDLQNLRVLSVSGNQLTDAGAAALKQLPHLKSLDISGNRITDAGLSSIAALKELETLSLVHWTGQESEMRITDAGLVKLAPMQELRELWLDGTDVTAKGLEILRHFPKLTLLSLRGQSITDEAMDQVARCTSVKTLYLHDTRIGDEGMARLAKLKDLEFLEIDDCPLTAKGLAFLAVLNELQDLQFSGVAMKPESFEQLSRITNLQRLGIYHPQGPARDGKIMDPTAGSNGVEKLKALPKLKSLTLGGSHDDQSLLSELSELQQLDELHLVFSSLSDERWLKLQEALPYTKVAVNPYVQDLHPVEMANLERLWKRVEQLRKPRPKLVTEPAAGVSP